MYTQQYQPIHNLIVIIPGICMFGGVDNDRWSGWGMSANIADNLIVPWDPCEGVFL
jgi:hypothetical protein